MSEILRIIADRITGTDTIERQLREYVDKGRSLLRFVPKLSETSTDFSTLGRNVPGTAPDWIKEQSRKLRRSSILASLKQSLDQNNQPEV